MWKKFLKKNNGPFIIPPGFTKAAVQSTNGQVFKIKLHTSCRQWANVTLEGDILHTASPYHVMEELQKYPSILCSVIKPGKFWTVATKSGICVVRIAPNIEISPLIRLKARLLGTVLIFEAFDFRDAKPWIVDDALISLKKDNLPTKSPSYLCKEQQIAFEFLIEQEKIKRIPQPEKDVKNILKKEGGDLISMVENENGYALSFNFKGRRRTIRIKEDLMLLDAGMCLDGGDQNYSLDSFLSILHNRGQQGWRDDGYDL